MNIYRWQVKNPLQNYQYILADEDMNAVLIDPLDMDEINSVVKIEKLRVKALLITHEHDDHACLSEALQERYLAPIFVSHAADTKIKGQLTLCSDRSSIVVSKTLTFTCLYTPGHTAAHAMFQIQDYLFSGDCLFHGGCGNCRYGSVQDHFDSIQKVLGALPQRTTIMPGHYYLQKNLKFSQEVEPGNRKTQSLSACYPTEASEMDFLSTLKNESEYNPFFRLGSDTLRSRLSEKLNRDLRHSSDFEIFRTLRELRDHF